MRSACLAAALVLLPINANAHLVGVEFGDFYAGSLHLMLAPEHVAAMLVVGLIGAHQSLEVARWGLIALPLGLLMGCLLSLVLAPGGFVDPLVAVSLAVGGCVGIAALRLPVVLVTALATLVGLIHGYANAVSAIGTPVDLFLYLSGIAAAGSVLGTLGLACATALMRWKEWVPLASRVLSSWIATVGVLMVGLALLR